jgi:hypothetical protein
LAIACRSLTNRPLSRRATLHGRPR